MAAVSRSKMLPSSARSSPAFEVWSKSPHFYMRIRTCARGARKRWRPWSTKMCGWRFRAQRGSVMARSAGPRSPLTRQIHRPEAGRPMQNSRRSRRCGITMRLMPRMSGGWSGACCVSGQWWEGRARRGCRQERDRNPARPTRPDAIYMIEWRTLGWVGPRPRRRAALAKSEGERARIRICASNFVEQTLSFSSLSLLEINHHVEPDIGRHVFIT
jgi:hypothetical protein